MGGERSSIPEAMTTLARKRDILQEMECNPLRRPESKNGVGIETICQALDHPIHVNVKV